MKNSTEVPRKLKIDVPYDPAFILLVYWKEMKHLTGKNTYTQRFIVVLLFTLSYMKVT